MSFEQNAENLAHSVAPYPVSMQQFQATIAETQVASITRETAWIFSQKFPGLPRSSLDTITNGAAESFRHEAGLTSDIAFADHWEDGTVETNNLHSDVLEHAYSYQGSEWI